MRGCQSILLSVRRADTNAVSDRARLSPSCSAIATPSAPMQTQPANLLAVFVADTSETELTNPFGN